MFPILTDRDQAPSALRRGRCSSSGIAAPSALVVMVIFLFLRTLSARTVIPSIAVPNLSIVEALSARHLFARLRLCVGPVSSWRSPSPPASSSTTAIVMIENIMRHIEDSDPPAASRAQGFRPDRAILSLTMSPLIAVFDSAALHGRYRRPVVPRICRGALASPFPFLPCFADAYAGHVRQVSASGATSPRSRARPTFLPGIGKHLQDDRDRILRPHAHLGVAAANRARWVAAATRIVHGAAFMFIPKGFFPVQDTGVILGISEAPQAVSFTAMAERQQPEHWPRVIPARTPRSREPLVVHRRRRPPARRSIAAASWFDPEAHRNSEDFRQRRDPTSTTAACQKWTESRFSCSRGQDPDGGRVSPGAAERNFNTVWKVPIRKSWPSGCRASFNGYKARPGLR